jgi:hypothetical protein
LEKKRFECADIAAIEDVKIPGDVAIGEYVEVKNHRYKILR